MSKSFITAMVLLAPLGGCGHIDPTYTAPFAEVGSGNATTNFGAATVNNMLVQQGAHAVAGTAEGPAGPRQTLSGRYAAAVIADYTASASASSAVTGSVISTGTGN